MGGFGALYGVGWERKEGFRSSSPYYDALDTTLSQDAIAYALFHDKP